MNIKDIFFTKLNQNELFSSEDNGGIYHLKVGQLIYKPLSATPEPILTSSLPFSPALRQTLAELYTQVGEISLSWHLREVDISKIREKEWLKENFPVEEYDDSYIDEILSGVINITSPQEMHEEKIEMNDNWYYPFDNHYSVIACFKEENGVIEDNIYLLNSQDAGNIGNMKIGCMEYLQLAYEAKLFYYWQYAYTYKDSLHNERLHKMLPEILEFVELDLSKFK